MESTHLKMGEGDEDVQDGPHEIRNGLLHRRDFHTLFDRRYITVDKNHNVEVSRHIKSNLLKMAS